jgi:hypothetical protein
VVFRSVGVAEQDAGEDEHRDDEGEAVDAEGGGGADEGDDCAADGGADEVGELSASVEEGVTGL